MKFLFLKEMHNKKKDPSRKDPFLFNSTIKMYREELIQYVFVLFVSSIIL